MRIPLYFILISLLLSYSSFSQLRLPSVLAAGMVMQQNDSVTIWGWGYNGDKLNITGSWNGNSVSTIINNHGKWSKKIKTPAAGGPFTLRIASSGQTIELNDIMIGEVWLCSGQSNMEWSYYNGAKFIKEEFPSAFNKNIRFYKVPRTASDYPQDDVKGEWQICDSNSLKGFSAVGYFFGKKLQQDLHVPIGLINASWGGTPAEVWTPAESIFNNEDLKTAAAQLKEVPWGPVKPGVNYNGMLSPLTNYSIAGAIWYQGEANVGTYSTYSQLLNTMIDTWRNKWKKDFPFYYVQIAPFTYGKEFEAALLQEQQTKSMSHSKTGMVVTTDLIDSVSNIHPSDKTEVGKRLANWALAETYHKDPGEYKSPVFRKAEIVKDKLVVDFEHSTGGLVAKDKRVTGFYIAGENAEWLPAEAKIEGNKVIVWNKNIKHPVHVRYGFSNTIIGNLFNKAGLPVIPFRTDTWDVLK